MDRNAYYLDGGNLARTLLLTMPPLPAGTPAWEHPAAAVHTDRAPSGVTDLLTWQARRIRLDVDVDTVTVAHLSNGHPVNGVLPDPMVAYRADLTPAKPLRVYSELSYHGWHQLHTLLADTTDWTTGRWLRDQVTAGLLDPATPVTLRMVAPSTDTYRARIDDLHTASTPTQLAAIADPRRARALTQLAIDHTTAVTMLERNLATAAGNLSSRHTDATLAYCARADPIVQRLLAGAADVIELERVTREHGRDLVDRAPQAAWEGRGRGGTLVTAARAEAWFFGGLKNAAAAYQTASDEIGA